MRTTVALVLAVALAWAATSCSGDRPSLGAAPVQLGGGSTTTLPGSTTTTTTLVPDVVGPEHLLGYIATPIGAPDVRALPVDTAPPLDVPAETPLGAPTTFAVIGDPTAPAQPAPGWLPVLLPTRPNGAKGWVQTASVTVSHTPLRLFVDLEGRELRVEDDGRERFRAAIAVGTEENPTPTGATYLTELVDSVEPDGAYGPWALGLALHSDTLTEFAGGDAQVGIHGTNRPDLIGQRVSSGCVRLANEDIEAVVDLQLPLGVPVFIT